MTNTVNSPEASIEKVYFEREAMIELLKENKVADWQAKVKKYLETIDRNDPNHRQALDLLRDKADRS